MEPKEVIKKVRDIREGLSGCWQANKARLKEEAGKVNLKKGVNDTVGGLFSVLDDWPGDMEGHFTIVKALEWLKGDVLIHLGDASGKEAALTERMDRALAALEDAAARVASLAAARH